MEFLVTSNNEITFSNKELQKSTTSIFKLGNSIKANWFSIAHIIAHVDETECYKDDGFNTVHEWVEKTFGIKKTASYSLLTIGKEYTREITSASGKVIGYGTNLIVDGEPDFSKTQIEKMLPGGHELATELVSSGEVTPDMSAKEISKVVKRHTNPEPDVVDDEPDVVDDERFIHEFINNDDVFEGTLTVTLAIDSDKVEFLKDILKDYMY